MNRSRIKQCHSLNFPTVFSDLHLHNVSIISLFHIPISVDPLMFTDSRFSVSNRDIGGDDSTLS